MALLIVLFLASCNPGAKISSYNVNDNLAPAEASFIYALPQTVIKLHILAEEVIFTPGPYAMYADKYLGIKNVPDKSENKWNILEMKVSSLCEIDPDYIYALNVQEDPYQIAGIKNLIEEGLILDVRTYAPVRVSSLNYPPKSDALLFTDLSVKRNFEAEKETEVSLVLPDTNYTAREAAKSGLKEKTPEQKAEEAANFIIKLRKRRFKLVSGQYEFMPQGEAMGEALKELARLEEEYLSLFTGKRTVSEVERDFYYTPVSEKETDRSVLLRFSDSEGFLTFREPTGKPVMIEIQSMNKVKGLEHLNTSKTSTEQILYRIAEQCSIKITAGEQIWIEAVFPVFQSGVTLPLNLNHVTK
jgi:hypothetical protein